MLRAIELNVFLPQEKGKRFATDPDFRRERPPACCHC
jgi:hypothetical protein